MKKHNFVSGAMLLFLGMVLGFLFAPIKKGIHIEISNNGNGNNGYQKEEAEE